MGSAYNIYTGGTRPGETENQEEHMNVNNRTSYEEDQAAFPSDAYTVDGYGGIAWHVYGWETQPGLDTEWDGIDERTGRVICVMVGDNRKFSVDPDEVHPLDELDYCHECGQVGCGHDGLEREA